MQTEFQRMAVPLVRQCLLSRAIRVAESGQTSAVALDFDYNGHHYEVAIFPADINMRSDDGSLFECFLRQEFASPTVQAQSFCRRLEALLDGGTWDDPFG